jgi:hypothetical protein
MGMIVVADVDLHDIDASVEAARSRVVGTEWRLRRPTAKVRLVPDDYFDERIARSYEAKWPELFKPAVVDAAVNFLDDLAGRARTTSV